MPPDSRSPAKAPKVIAMCARTFLRSYQLGIAKKLKERFDCQIHFYTISDADKKFYEKLDTDGVFDSVTVETVLANTVRAPGPAPEGILSRAAKIESEYGVRFNKMMLNNRHLGRGYALTGFYHPRSAMSEDTGFEKSISGFVASFDFWLNEVSSKKIDLMINPNNASHQFFPHLGVPFVNFVEARLKNLAFWTKDPFFYNEEIEQVFDDVGEEERIPIETAPFAHLEMRKAFLKNTKLYGVVKQAVLQTLRKIYRTIRGTELSAGYYLRDEVAYYFRKRKSLIDLMGKKTVSLEEIGDQKFVYFPLHTEPEMALQGISPEFFFQHAAIAAIARDLPVDTLLCVKDTYEAIGRRPDNFYDQLLDLKNVRLLNVMEMGVEVIKKSHAVLTISGTSGQEALAMGKPVVTFGDHNNYNFLNGVRRVDSLYDLRSVLEWATADDYDTESGRAEGERFLGAIKRVSFDMGRYNHASLEKSYEQESLDAGFENLIKTLERYGMVSA